MAAVADPGMKHAPGQKFGANVFSKKTLVIADFFGYNYKDNIYFQIQYGAREMAKKLNSSME